MRSPKLRAKSKLGRWFPLALCVALSSNAAPIPKRRPQQEAVQFLHRVRETIDIGATGNPPFVLQTQVVAAPMERGKSQFDGTYELNWASPDLWKEEVTFAGNHRVRVASQGKLWTTSDLPFLPVRVHELEQLFDLRSQWTLQPGESRDLQKAKTHTGIHTLRVKIKSDSGTGSEVCADDSTFLTVRPEMPLPSNPVRPSFEYA
jgi:hypothetical protein